VVRTTFFNAAMLASKSSQTLIVSDNISPLFV
jgi:hypothetical protein